MEIIYTDAAAAIIQSLCSKTDETVGRLSNVSRAISQRPTHTITRIGALDIYLHVHCCQQTRLPIRIIVLDVVYNVRAISIYVTYVTYIYMYIDPQGSILDVFFLCSFRFCENRDDAVMVNESPKNTFVNIILRRNKTIIASIMRRYTTPIIWSGNGVFYW